MRSYRRQLLAGLTLVLLGLLLGGYHLFRSAVADTVLQEARESAVEELRTVAYTLGQTEGRAPEREVRQRLSALGRRSNSRLSLLNSEGRLLLDTALASPQQEQAAASSGRPEIEEAASRGMGSSIRYSPEVHLKYLFVAQKVQNLAGMEEGYLRLGKPYGPLGDRISAGTRPFFWLLLIAALLSVPVYFFLDRRLNREIDRITGEVETIGSHAGRTSHATLNEFDPMIRNINRISEQTHHYLQQLSIQRDELEAILNGLADGVAVLDSGGRIRRYNRAMADIVRSQQDLTGRMPIECIPSNELQDAVEEMLAGETAGGARSLYLTLYNQAHFEAALLPIVFEQASAAEIILVLHEVTELKRLEQVRRDFVANISHELRTPITSIKGYTETLLHSPPRDPQTLTSFMRVIAKNVDNLAKLVDNLTQLSKAEDPEKGPAREEVDLVRVTEAAWEVCEPQAQQKRIQLRREGTESAPIVLGDREQLMRVLINLLDNAIKYSPEEEEIGLQIQDRGAWWQVAIRDRGPGVPSGVQSRIFERFFRGETGRSKDLPGTGLGLAICKHILQRHGGRIWVESPAPGRMNGSRFLFRLPKLETTQEEISKD